MNQLYSIDLRVKQKLPPQFRVSQINDCWLKIKRKNEGIEETK